FTYTFTVSDTLDNESQIAIDVIVVPENNGPILRVQRDYSSVARGIDRGNDEVEAGKEAFYTIDASHDSRNLALLEVLDNSNQVLLSENLSGSNHQTSFSISSSSGSQSKITRKVRLTDEDGFVKEDIVVLEPYVLTPLSINQNSLVSEQHGSIQFDPQWQYYFWSSLDNEKLIGVKDGEDLYFEFQGCETSIYQNQSIRGRELRKADSPSQGGNNPFYCGANLEIVYVGNCVASVGLCACETFLFYPAASEDNTVFIRVSSLTRNDQVSINSIEIELIEMTVYCSTGGNNPSTISGSLSLSAN
ncbi:MAG: hypothetical protein ACPF8V_12190, partial [Luteibaculum sp.]